MNNASRTKLWSRWPAFVGCAFTAMVVGWASFLVWKESGAAPGNRLHKQATDSVVHASITNSDRHDDAHPSRKSSSTTRPFNLVSALQVENDDAVEHDIVEADSDADLPLMPHTLSQEALDQELREEEEAFLSDYESETLDHAWADSMTRSLVGGLTDSLSSIQGFENADVGCKSTRCVAEVRWQNYGSARKSVYRFIGAPRGACEISWFLPETEDPDRPYGYKLLYEKCR